MLQPPFLFFPVKCGRDCVIAQKKGLFSMPQCGIAMKNGCDRLLRERNTVVPVRLMRFSRGQAVRR